MFRVTSHIEEEDDVFVLTLEGSLVGAWVRELETYWREVTRGQRQARLCVDLREVYHVDESGHELMARMYRAGARFMTAGCVIPELVREIAESAHSGQPRRHGSGGASGGGRH